MAEDQEMQNDKRESIEISRIEQLKELRDGKTYYLRLTNNASREELVNFSKEINSLNLKCAIIVGSGKFDIVEVDQ
jgi:hypothetical protein